MSDSQKNLLILETGLFPNHEAFASLPHDTLDLRPLKTNEEWDAALEKILDSDLLITY